MPLLQQHSITNNDNKKRPRRFEVFFYAFSLGTKMPDMLNTFGELKNQAGRVTTYLIKTYL